MNHGTYKFSPPEASLLQILHRILMKIWAIFSTRWPAFPACPVIKKSCRKPSELPKFSVILGSLVRAGVGGGWGGGGVGGHGEAEVIYYKLYTI